MDLSNMFGSHPARPEHPDFWKLSDIILDLDGAMHDGMDQGKEIDDIIGEKAAQVGDSYSIVYVALQRAMRIHGVETAGELQQNAIEVSRTATIYMEAMIVGARLMEKRNEA